MDYPSEYSCDDCQIVYTEISSLEEYQQIASDHEKGHRALENYLKNRDEWRAKYLHLAELEELP